MYLLFFSTFINFVENQFSTTIKTVRSDNGSEFLNKALATMFAAKGILHQTTCVYTPQQNGLVERKHRSLLNVARALRFHSSTPIGFWGDCLLTAAYLMNRTPSPLLHGCTPYEIQFKSPPDFQDLKVFWCLCHATVMPRPTDKFVPRSLKGVFVGYPFTKKGFKVLNLQTRQIIISRDGTFFETIFPFATIETPSLSQLFPKSPTFIDCDSLCTHDNTSDATARAVTDELNSCHSDTHTTTSSAMDISHVSTRPHRARQLPVRFTNYTGLPAHLHNSIQLRTCISNDSSSLHSYVSSLPFDPTHVFHQNFRAKHI